MPGTVFGATAEVGASRFVDADMNLQTPLAVGGAGPTTARLRNHDDVLTATYSMTLSPVAGIATGRGHIGIPNSNAAGIVPGFFATPRTTRPASGSGFVRQMVWRFIDTILFPVGAPTDDCGSLIKIAFGTASALAQSFSQSALATGSGTAGMGLLMVNAANTYCWVNKQTGTASGVYAEIVTPIPNNPGNLSDGSWHVIEHRIYDATPTAEARYELWIDNVKCLTRYWVNPSGVVTTLLQPFDTATGNQLAHTIRNHSTNSGTIAVANAAVIFGAVDQSTLAPFST